MTQPTKASYASAKIREQTEFMVNRPKVLIHLFIWLAALASMAWVFILPYAGTGAGLIPTQALEGYGDEVFLGVGVLICGLIIWYIAILASKLLLKGPLFRTSSEGLWLCQAKNFFISKKSIRAVYVNHRFGMASTAILELNDRNILLDLQEEIPRLASITCDTRRCAVNIELAGLNNKKGFTTILARLGPRLR